jgi:hypothetical protein
MTCMRSLMALPANSARAWRSARRAWQRRAAGTKGERRALVQRPSVGRRAGHGARRRSCARSSTRRPSRATGCPVGGPWSATPSACAWTCRRPSSRSGLASERVECARLLAGRRGARARARDTDLRQSTALSSVLSRQLVDIGMAATGRHWDGGNYRRLTRRLFQACRLQGGAQDHLDSMEPLGVGRWGQGQRVVSQRKGCTV